MYMVDVETLFGSVSKASLGSLSLTTLYKGSLVYVRLVKRK